MTPFSASDAALEGFQLVRRRWRVVLGWAGFNLLALAMIVVLSAILSVVAGAVGGSGANAPVLAVAGLFLLVCALVAQAVIATGVFRLELRPEEPAFLHLRLGRDELRLVLVWLIWMTGAWVFLWAGALVGQALAGGSGLVELVVAAAAVYISLRFALVAPVSFAEGGIDFPRSWRLTRGRVLALLGMSALSFCLIMLMMLTVLVALVVVTLVAGGFNALSGLFGGAEALQTHPGIYLLAFTVEIVLTPVLWVLAMAPLAKAYRAFTEDAGA